MEKIKFFLKIVIHYGRCRQIFPHTRRPAPGFPASNPGMEAMVPYAKSRREEIGVRVESLTPGPSPEERGDVIR
jgi:hypothetical protein